MKLAEEMVRCKTRGEVTGLVDEDSECCTGLRAGY